MADQKQRGKLQALSSPDSEPYVRHLKLLKNNAAYLSVGAAAVVLRNVLSSE